MHVVYYIIWCQSAFGSVYCSTCLVREFLIQYYAYPPTTTFKLVTVKKYNPSLFIAIDVAVLKIIQVLISPHIHTREMERLEKFDARKIKSLNLIENGFYYCTMKWIKNKYRMNRDGHWPLDNHYTFVVGFRGLIQETKNISFYKIEIRFPANS